MDLAPGDVHAPAAIGEKPSSGGAKKAAALTLLVSEWGAILSVSRPEPPHEMAFPCGEIEDGESPERAAARELMEETGVSAHELVPVATIKSPTDGRTVHVFRAGRWSGTPCAMEPDTKVSWLSPRDLLSQSSLYRECVQQLIDLGVLGATRPHVMSISAAKRKAIPKTEFALPSQRKYPLDTAARTRNAAARLEQMKKSGKVSDAEYKQAKGRIATAAKKFGIDSEYNSSDAAPKTKAALHIRADLAPGGALHVRHLTDRGVRTLDGVLLSDATAPEDGKPVWIQVAKSGAFQGHPMGAFELNAKVFGEIIANFKSTLNRRIPIDYEHASEQDPTSGSIPTSGAPAQGWITDLKIEGGNLWGLVEWLPQARDQIRSGQYRYLSPAVRFGAKDRVTGKPIGARLTSAALTNEPFLDGMAPLAARDIAGTVETMGTTLVTASALDRPVHSAHETMPGVKRAMGLHELASPQECSDRLDRIRECCMSAGGPAGMFDGVDLSTYTGALRTLVNPTHGMTWDDVFDRVQDMIDAAMDEHLAEYHPEASVGASDPSEEDTTMADEALVTQLTDRATTAETKVTTLETQVTGLETEKQTLLTENSTLTLTVKNEKSRADTAETAIKDAGVAIVLKDGETLLDAIKRVVAENTALLADKAKRDEADLDAEVMAAFDTYKAARKLTDSDVPHMKRIAKADRDGFRGMYPPVPPSERHLLREIAPPAPRPTESQTRALTLNELTVKIMTEEKVSFADAQIMASERLGTR